MSEYGPHSSGGVSPESQQKIENVAAQIAECERGTRVTIICPYCGEQNKQGQPLCCETFAKAAMAVIQRQGQAELIEHAGRIAEAIARN